MKIVLIGAGSYVFGPSVLAQIYLEQSLPDVDLALVDPDMETIGLLGAVGRRMARESGLATRITTHAEREKALGGADFVICSASPQMQRRFAMDCDIVDQHLPGHQVTEFGGIAGFSYSLRSIAFIDGLTADMKRLCPDAWLLDVTNPLPRVAQAAQENGIRTAGFCLASISAYAMLWNLFTGQTLQFPFTQAQERWSITTAGLNHFAWLLELRDRETGADLLTDLRDRTADGDFGTINPMSKELLRKTGYMLVPGDEHTRDFLAPATAHSPRPEATWHGSARQRKDRIQLLRQVADGVASWNPLLKNGAWEKPGQFIHALSGGPTAHFHSMNLLNDQHQVTNLPPHVFVETPCDVSSTGVKPLQVTLPASVLPLCERTVHVTDTIVRAARMRSRARVRDVVLLDPTILDKSAGLLAINACLTAHADMLPAYA